MAGGKKISDIQKDNIGARYKELGFTYSAPEKEKVEKDSTMDSEAEEKLIFFYHPDHLGSTFYVTDADGNIAQHIEYIPYGEVFVEERNSKFSTNFLFNAKELDNETGLYYYGARYLDPTGAMWLSVDPMWEKYIDANLYNYCHGNPVTMVDPDGRDDVSIEYKDNKWSISQVVLDGSGDDRFFIRIDGKSSIDVVRFSNGDPEKRINCLNLYVGEEKSSYTLGVYHISGRNEDGATGFFVTPGGDASLTEGSGRRVPEGSYPLSRPGSSWKQPGVGGTASGRGVRFHFAKGNARKWTEGCFVISSDYTVDDKGNVIYDGEKSKAHLTSFDKALDATRIYDYEYSDRCRIGTQLPAESYDRTVNVKTAKKIWQKK